MNHIKKFNEELTPLQNLNEMVNAFTKEASIERLEQVSYTFRDNLDIVEKIQELISMIESYN